MAIFVPEVAAPYLMKEIDKRLVISNAALDISADVPEIEWKGSEITFPVYSRVAVASQVDSKGSVTPTEIDGIQLWRSAGDKVSHIARRRFFVQAVNAHVKLAFALTAVSAVPEFSESPHS